MLLRAPNHNAWNCSPDLETGEELHLVEIGRRLSDEHSNFTWILAASHRTQICRGVLDARLRSISEGVLPGTVTCQWPHSTLSILNLKHSLLRTLRSQQNQSDASAKLNASVLIRKLKKERDHATHRYLSDEALEAPA